MKVSIDDDRCAGHGVCCALCPQVFVLTDAGYAIVADPGADIPAEHEGAVRQAIASCPEAAISAG
jgi:ferredoxin